MCVCVCVCVYFLNELHTNFELINTANVQYNMEVFDWFNLFCFYRHLHTYTHTILLFVVLF